MECKNQGIETICVHEGVAKDPSYNSVTTSAGIEFAEDLLSDIKQAFS